MFGVLMPLIICHGLQELPSALIMRKDLKVPPKGYRNILGIILFDIVMHRMLNFTAMFLTIVGYTCFNTMKNMKLGMKIDELPLFLPLSIIAFILQGIIWFIPPVFIGSWMQHFIDKCKEKNCAMSNFDFCFTTYGQIEVCFKNYFIVFFSSSQIYSIVVTFLSFSTFFSKDHLTHEDYLSFGSMLLLIFRKVSKISP